MTLVGAVGKRLEALLRERHMTKYRLEKEGGVPRQTVAAIIGGKNKTVSLNIIYQIANTLGLTLEEFFNDEVFFAVTE